MPKVKAKHDMVLGDSVLMRDKDGYSSLVPIPWQLRVVPINLKNFHKIQNIVENRNVQDRIIKWTPRLDNYW